MRPRLDLRQAEGGVFGGDAEVCREHGFHAAGQAGAVDGGDDRLVERVVAEGGAGEDRRVVQQAAVPVVLGQAGAGEEGQGEGEVAAGAEGAVAGAGEHDGANGGIDGGFGEGVGEQAGHLRGDGVPAGRAIEGEEQHAGLDVTEEVRGFGHALSIRRNASARSSTLRILPLGVWGKPGTKAMWRGILWRLKRARGPGAEGVLGEGGGLAQDDEGEGFLAELRIGHADDLGLLDGGVVHEHALDLGGVEVLAAADHHVLDAADDAGGSPRAPAWPGRRCAASRRGRWRRRSGRACRSSRG